MTDVRISVIIPALNEEAQLAACIASARGPCVREVIVVDGGSVDRTAGLAREIADAVLSAARGRAVQMNAGAAAASGDVLLFLHADTRLPGGFDADVMAALADPKRSAADSTFAWPRKRRCCGWSRC